MKKILSLLLVVCITFSLFGCGESKKQGEATQQVQESEQPQEQLKENPTTDFKYNVGDSSISITEYIGSSKLVVIPEEIENKPVMSINTRAFYLKNVEKVVMPSTITIIASFAFSECTSLKEVVFSENITHIMEGAFYGCTSLLEVRLPEKLAYMERYAFFNCTSLAKVHINKNLSETRDQLFYNCPITELTFEDGLKKIGSYGSFWSDARLENIIIPASVEQIIGYSFSDNLESVTFLGDAPKEIGDEPFGTKAVIYYKKGTKGWETTPLKEQYTLIEK